MIPLPLLVAIVLAFGLGLEISSDLVPGFSLQDRVVAIALAVAAIGLLSRFLGSLLVERAKRRALPPAKARRRLSRLHRLLGASNLLLFAAIILALGWPRVVASALGGSTELLPQGALNLLPFLVGQVLVWAGLYSADQLLRPLPPSSAKSRGLLAHLLARSRATFALVLPAVFLYAGAYDLAWHLLPGLFQIPYISLLGTAALAALILIAAPAFVRLAWPTRPLPEGPLRDRLENLARRARFRCTDILLWNTGGTLANAGVTGASPYYRYVLLTDALIDHLDDEQIEAVFGHEIGHIAHRHLGYFALFFLGSLGVLALLSQGIESLALAIPGVARFLLQTRWSLLIEVGSAALGLGLLAAYFLPVFGYLSRRFERQADIFGCRAVSCGRDDCPPHGPESPRFPHAKLCPTGIRIFSQALANVALLNGMEPSAHCWRHGSINRRIAFLSKLENNPSAEQQFQRRLGRLRLALGLLLLASLLVAAGTGALDYL